MPAGGPSAPAPAAGKSAWNRHVEPGGVRATRIAGRNGLWRRAGLALYNL